MTGADSKIMNKMTEKQISYVQESLCICIAICFGIAVYLGLRLRHGYWIPMTTAIMFLAANQGQGAIIRKTMDRVVGTLTGALLGFLYIKIFMYGNYHWGYLLPLIWFAGFYVYFITSNYALMAVMITMFVPMLIAIMTVDPIGIGDTLIKRIACTGFGVSIALVAEYVIYRKASSAAPAMKYNTKTFFHSQGEIIRLSSDFFLDVQQKTEEHVDNFRKQVWGFVSSMSSLENLYLSIRYEFDYKKDQDLFYQYLFVHIAKLNRNTRKLMGLTGHDKYDNSVFESTYSQDVTYKSCCCPDKNKNRLGHISNLGELKKISEMLCSKYKNLIQYFNGRTDNCTEHIKNLLNSINHETKMTPTYLYIEVLYEFSKLADELSNAVCSKTFSS
jgi:hypothetical protein